MTTYELTQQLQPFVWEIGLALLGLPIITYLLGALPRACVPAIGRGFLALALFVSIVPGMSMAVVVLYMILFVHANLLRDMNLVLHLLPILSMLGTLWAAAALVPFEQIPGFARIQGFMILAASALRPSSCSRKRLSAYTSLGALNTSSCSLAACWRSGNLACHACSKDRKSMLGQHPEPCATAYAMLALPGRQRSSPMCIHLRHNATQGSVTFACLPAFPYK